MSAVHFKLIRIRKLDPSIQNYFRGMTFPGMLHQEVNCQPFGGLSPLLKQLSFRKKAARELI